MLAFGLAVLGALIWASRAFARASVASVKALLAWVLALGGLSLAALLVLTGKGGLAIAGVTLAGPAIWSWWKQQAPLGRRPAVARAAPMDRAEALEVLGLADPVSEAQIRDAWVRLMRAAHPDHGGSDWLATRINQARDVLSSRR